MSTKKIVRWIIEIDPEQIEEYGQIPFGDAHHIQGHGGWHIKGDGSKVPPLRISGPHDVEGEAET